MSTKDLKKASIFFAVTGIDASKIKNIRTEKYLCKPKKDHGKKFVDRIYFAVFGKTK